MSLAAALCVTLLGAAPDGPSAQGQWLDVTLDEPLPPPAAHYLVGNESRHDLFAGALAGRGGAYLGVGGEQNYTLAAMAEASWIFVIDRDPRIAALHRELGRRIVGAKDAAALLAGLEREAPAEPLRAAWPAIVRHLRRVATPSARAYVRTWLSDPVLFDRVRQTWLLGHVEAVVGDLAGELSMASIARAAAARSLRFTVIYLSNVEEGLAGMGALIENLRRLPRAGDAVIVRTFFLPDERGDGRFAAADGLWSYQTQSAEDLVSEGSRTFAEMMGALARAGAIVIDAEHQGLSRVRHGPGARSSLDARAR